MASDEFSTCTGPIDIAVELDRGMPFIFFISSNTDDMRPSMGLARRIPLMALYIWSEVNGGCNAVVVQ